MPRKKLTLSVEENVIEKAKRFSERHDTSVSKLVTEFLSRLAEARGNRTPVVSRLRGIVPRETDTKEYYRHLRRKYRR